MNLLNRLFKEGIITTIIGLLVIILAVCVWAFVKDVPATEVVIIAGIGSGLLFIKDEHIGLK